jgi:hypothetical protein
MPSWVARVNTCESHRRERAAKQKERNTKATERKNKAAHRERTSKATERKNKHHHRERTDKTNKERNSKHHSRERTSKANERKGKAANTCKHGVIIYQHYHFRGYGRRFYRGRYDMNAMIRKGVKNDDASSAKVYNGCKLIIYQHSRFNGRAAGFDCNHGGWCKFDYNTFTRRGVGNDHMSSLRVCNRNGSGC